MRDRTPTAIPGHFGYQLPSVRTDVAAHGVTAPTGVGVCDRCRRVLLESAALREHRRVADAVS